VFGFVARVIPSRKVQFRLVRAALRWSGVAGSKVELPDEPAILAANRTGGSDLLRLIASLPAAALILDQRELSRLGSTDAFLLEPLLAPGSGGLLGRAETTIERGFHGIALADSPAGEPGARCRFRLELFQAGAAAAVWISSHALAIGKPLDRDPERSACSARSALRESLASLQSAVSAPRPAPPPR
jgi:hypothetical protein